MKRRRGRERKRDRPVTTCGFVQIILSVWGIFPGHDLDLE